MERGRTVYLRPVRKEDMESFYRAVQDDDIRYMTGTRRVFTMDELYDHYERITNDGTRYDFAICLQDGDETSAICRFWTSTGSTGKPDSELRSTAGTISTKGTALKPLNWRSSLLLRSFN